MSELHNLEWHELIARVEELEALRNTSIAGARIKLLEAENEKLEKDLAQARAGCYACEPVAIENKRLRKAIEFAIAQFEHDEFRSVIEQGLEDTLQEIDNED